MLRLSSLVKIADTFADSVDHNEIAYNVLSRKNMKCVPHVNWLRIAVQLFLSFSSICLSQKSKQDG